MLLQHAEASGGCSCCAGPTGPTLTLPRARHSRAPTATLSPTLGLRMGNRVFPRSRRRPKGLVPSTDSFRTTGTAVPKMPLSLEGSLGLTEQRSSVSQPRSQGHGVQTSTFPQGCWLLGGPQPLNAAGPWAAGPSFSLPVPFLSAVPNTELGKAECLSCFFFKAAWVRGRPEWPGQGTSCLGSHFSFLLFRPGEVGRRLSQQTSGSFFFLLSSGIWGRVYAYDVEMHQRVLGRFLSLKVKGC